jgi:hypothetical protein
MKMIYYKILWLSIKISKTYEILEEEGVIKDLITNDRQKRDNKLKKIYRIWKEAKILRNIIH